MKVKLLKKIRKEYLILRVEEKSPSLFCSYFIKNNIKLKDINQDHYFKLYKRVSFLNPYFNTSLYFKGYWYELIDSYTSIDMLKLSILNSVKYKYNTFERKIKKGKVKKVWHV